MWHVPWRGNFEGHVETEFNEFNIMKYLSSTNEPREIIVQGLHLIVPNVYGMKQCHWSCELQNCGFNRSSWAEKWFSRKFSSYHRRSRSLIPCAIVTLLKLYRISIYCNNSSRYLESDKWLLNMKKIDPFLDTRISVTKIPGLAKFLRSSCRRSSPYCLLQLISYSHIQYIIYRTVR